MAYDNDSDGLTPAQLRDFYFMTLRNPPGEDRISDWIKWESSPEYEDLTQGQNAFPPVEEALSALFFPEEVQRYTQGATFAELWPALDALELPLGVQPEGASREVYDIASEAVSRWAYVAGDITQTQSFLRQCRHFTNDERLEHQRVTELRDARLSEITGRSDDRPLDESRVDIVEAYRVDLGYATYLADQAHEYCVRTGMRSDDLFAERAERYREETVVADKWLVELGVTAESQGQTQPDLDDEEAKKRRAGQTVDAGNPADAQLGANIRPEVGSGPGGLETYTTQKSAVYEASPNAEQEAEAVEEIDETRDQNEIRLRTEEQQQGDGLTPAEPAETRKMTPQERQDARREAREAAEMEHRSELDARSAALDRSGGNLDREESHTFSAGISL